MYQKVQYLTSRFYISRDVEEDHVLSSFLKKMERTQRLKYRPVGPASLLKRQKIEVKLIPSVDVGRCECSDPSCRLRHHDSPVFSPPSSPELCIGRDAHNRGKSVFDQDMLTRERLEIILSAKCCCIHPDGSINEIDLSLETESMGCITPDVGRRLLGQLDDLEEGEIGINVFPLDVEHVMNNTTRYKNSPDAIDELRSRIAKKSIFFPSKAYWRAPGDDPPFSYGTIRNLLEPFVHHFVVVCDTELLAM